MSGALESVRDGLIGEVLRAHLAALYASAGAAVQLAADGEARSTPRILACLASCQHALESAAALAQLDAGTPAKGPGCPKCEAPADRQRNVTGMGDETPRWLCLECGDEHE